MTQSAEKDAVLDQAARAVAIAAGDGCFDRINAGGCHFDLDCDCTDHEDAAYYRSIAAAALTAASEQIARSIEAVADKRDPYWREAATSRRGAYVNGLIRAARLARETCDIPPGRS